MPDGGNTGYTKWGRGTKVKNYVGRDGQTYTLDLSGWSDGYKSDNWFRKGGGGSYLDAYIQYFLQHGVVPANKEALAEYMGVDASDISDKSFSTASKDFNTFTEKNKINTQEYKINSDAYNAGETGTNAVSEQDAAYNEYWRTIYPLDIEDDSTLGGSVYNHLEEAERNAALSNLQLADAQYQQAAMQQAETVKAITDQVRAERMSRLRAGMNEAQIANQDMQMMLNNMNILNQQANAMNYNRLASQQQYDLAKDTAYQQYLDYANGLSQSAAAMAASDAGSLYQQTLKDQYKTGRTYSQSRNSVSGADQNK